MTRRGFTLIEVLIVLSLMGIMLVVFGEVFMAEYRLFHTVASLTDLRTEAEGAVHRVLRHGRGTIDADNRGIHFADGTQVLWKGTALLLNGRPLTTHPVTTFAAVRRGKDLEVLVGLEDGKARYRAVARR